MNKHLSRLINEGEHQQLDFKFAITDARKIARSLAAFANTDGGRLLIGVKDNGKIAGVRSEEEIFMIEAAAQMYCRPEVYFETVEWTVDKKRILEVIIPQSKNKPHYAPQDKENYKVYVRVDDQNLLANSVMLRVWKQQKKQNKITLIYSETEKLLLKYLHENDEITLKEFRNLTHINKYKAETILSKLILMNIIQIRLTEKAAFYSLKEEKAR